MPANRNVGPSITKLELANNSASERNPKYVAAKKEYDKIIENVTSFINQHAPVTQVVLSRNAYKNGVDIYNPNSPENELYLSADYVSNPLGWNHTVYISTHTITPMLRHILLTEGWHSYTGNNTYCIELSKNGNISWT
jgi:hypothetical protein